MTNKVYSFLGLAKKAGKLVSGETGCENAVRGEKAHLVIVTQDASANTSKKFKDACNYRDIPFLQYGEKETLGRLLGKEIRSVVAVTDVQFAQNLMEMIRNQQGIEKMHGGGLIE